MAKMTRSEVKEALQTFAARRLERAKVAGPEEAARCKREAEAARAGELLISRTAARDYDWCRDHHAAGPGLVSSAIEHGMCREE